MLLWIVSYVVLTLFWLWIIRWGGAEWIEGRLISGFLVNIWAVTWTAEGIKFFGWGALVINTVLFVLGMIWSDFRNFSFF